MIRRAAGAVLVLASLAAPAAAEEVPFEALARGDSGPDYAGCTVLDDEEVPARWTLGDDQRAARIALGEQPAGTELAVERVVSGDRFGFDVEVEASAVMPVEADRTARPFVVVAIPRPFASAFLDQDVRVRLRLRGALLEPMDLEDAADTRRNLLRMDRSERGRIAELSARNAAGRERIRELNRRILATADSEAYGEALSELSWEDRLRRAADRAALATDVELFGSTFNPLIPTGDGRIRHLTGEPERWEARLEEVYAEERAAIDEEIAELEAKLARMRSFAGEADAGPREGLADAVSRD